MALRSHTSSTEFSKWRYELLTRAGFEPGLARELTADARIDIHQLLELTDRGCPPPLAARILAPLDWPEEER